MDSTQVSNYARQHRGATALLLKATREYAAARCLTINGMPGVGFSTGAQAIEKFLKAYILFLDPKCSVGSFKHSLEKLLEVADRLTPSLNLSRFQGLVTRFTAHYNSRYPQNRNGSHGSFSPELVELDELIMFINENLQCPRNVKYRTGLYAEITFSLTAPGISPSPAEKWIKADNRTLQPLLQEIERQFAMVMAELRPTS